MTQDSSHLETTTSVPIVPRRPETGLQAWIATVGHIGAEHSPDVVLSLRVDASGWGAELAWAHEHERVTGRASAADVLRDLWREVALRHRLLRTQTAMLRQPAGYEAGEWLDAETADALRRLLAVTGTAFDRDWLIMFIYRPVSTPELRAQARLLARANSVQVGGSGATLRDACLELYRHAAPVFFSALKSRAAVSRP